MAPPDYPAGYLIREWRPGDDEALVAVENRAADLFRDHGYPEIADSPFPGIDEFRAMAQGHQVLVATTDDGSPVGYAVFGPRGAFLHLRELSVDPAHGRRGLGAALVRRVVAAAQARAVAGVSLTTFRHVPFNAPFYAGLGFNEMTLDEAPAILQRTFREELPPSVEPRERVLMLCETGGSMPRRNPPDA